MKDEYDFSNAERGRFYRPPTTLVPPVHLDADVLAFFAARAADQRMSLNELLNDVLRKNIEAIQGAE